MSRAPRARRHWSGTRAAGLRAGRRDGAPGGRRRRPSGGGDGAPRDLSAAAGRPPGGRDGPGAGPPPSRAVSAAASPPPPGTWPWSGSAPSSKVSAGHGAPCGPRPGGVPPASARLCLRGSGPGRGGHTAPSCGVRVGAAQAGLPRLVKAESVPANGGGRSHLQRPDPGSACRRARAPLGRARTPGRPASGLGALPFGPGSGGRRGRDAKLLLTLAPSGSRFRPRGGRSTGAGCPRIARHSLR